MFIVFFFKPVRYGSLSICFLPKRRETYIYFNTLSSLLSKAKPSKSYLKRHVAVRSCPRKPGKGILTRILLMARAGVERSGGAHTGIVEVLSTETAANWQTLDLE